MYCTATVTTALWGPGINNILSFALRDSQVLPKRHVVLFVTRNTDMRRLTMGVHSDKCVLRRFRRFANVIDCTYTNLDSIVY